MNKIFRAIKINKKNTSIQDHKVLVILIKIIIIKMIYITRNNHLKKIYILIILNITKYLKL